MDGLKHIRTVGCTDSTTIQPYLLGKQSLGRGDACVAQVSQDCCKQILFQDIHECGWTEAHPYCGSLFRTVRVMMLGAKQEVLAPAAQSQQMLDFTYWGNNPLVGATHASPTSVDIDVNSFSLGTYTNTDGLKSIRTVEVYFVRWGS